MEAVLSNASGSTDNFENSHGDLHYGLLPAFSTSSLRSEIPERLLQDDASTLSPSYSDQNTSSATHTLQQENACSPREQPLQQNDPVQQGQVVFPRHEDAQDHPEDVSESSTALFQEQNHAETDEDVRKPSRKPYSWKEKLGTLAIVGLVAGFVLLCASIGTLAFMWFGSPSIPAWKEITARNWLSKSISICIGVIQQVMMLQLGIVTASLASLALESRDVMVGDVASVSAMRASATSTGAFVMAWQYLSGGSYRNARHASNIFLIITAALLWCLSQFLLLIILTDVSLRSTAGLASPATLPYSLHYNLTRGVGLNTQFQKPSVGAWHRKISQYASFAEYSESPFEADGVSDTGVTLRAFLPFRAGQDRENLESYKGRSTVLDARVTCQVPQIKNATLDSDRRFRGSLAATRNTPRLANSSLDEGSGAKGPAAMDASFDCIMAWGYDSHSTRQWPLSLCQLWGGHDANTGSTEDFGGLYSEFQDPSRMGGAGYQGSAYLFLNTTLGDIWNPPGLVAEASQERGEWLDLIFSNGSITLSASICYAAFDFADLHVSISSQSNRSESRLEPVFNRDTSTYTFQELRYAMGQDRSLSIDRRGMLELAKIEGVWKTTPVGQYLQSRLHLARDLRSTADLGFTHIIGWDGIPSVTGVLDGSPQCSEDPCVSPQTMHIWLMQEILNTNGSIAFALQTMITLLSSMAYYDQMGQFDKWTQAEVTFFQTAQVPVGYIGFAAVTITVIAHCILVAYCVSLFLRKTSLSRLGASWSAVAQVATGDVMEYLEHATNASDNEIQARLKADGKKSSNVCLEEIDGQVSISIIRKNEEK